MRIAQNEKRIPDTNHSKAFLVLAKEVLTSRNGLEKGEFYSAEQEPILLPTKKMVYMLQRPSH